MIAINPNDESSVAPIATAARFAVPPEPVLGRTTSVVVGASVVAVAAVVVGAWVVVGA